MEKRQANGAHAEKRHGRHATDDTDHGLAALREAAAAYTRQREELLEERAHVAQLEREVRTLAERSAAEARRSAALLASVQAMHRALFSGGTAEHVLRASLDITEAERGYYVAEERGLLHVRAAVDVPASPGDRPTPFIAGITERVLASGEALHWLEDAPPEGLTPAEDEQFREGVAVPVTIRGGSCAVIIALDRDGRFHEEDVSNLLNVGSEAGVAVENARLRADLQRVYTATIAMLADTVSAKDPYTQGHCEQVSRYARVAAASLELSPEDQRVACYAALLHDVGKIGVSDGVLNKPGPLIAEERKLVEAHVRIGHDLVAGIPALTDVATAILHHHEWWDGTGYPEGLAGDDIPVASRIVAVVDAYCAMLDKRSYKESSTAAEARAELRRCAGTQFDPAIVEVVLEAIERTDAEEASGLRHDQAQAGCGLLPDMLLPRS